MVVVFIGAQCHYRKLVGKEAGYCAYKYHVVESVVESVGGGGICRGVGYPRPPVLLTVCGVWVCVA